MNLRSSTLLETICRYRLFVIFVFSIGVLLLLMNVGLLIAGTDDPIVTVNIVISAVTVALSFPVLYLCRKREMLQR